MSINERIGELVVGSRKCGCLSDDLGYRCVFKPPCCLAIGAAYDSDLNAVAEARRVLLDTFTKQQSFIAALNNRRGIICSETATADNIHRLLQASVGADDVLCFMNASALDQCEALLEVYLST